MKYLYLAILAGALLVPHVLKADMALNGQSSQKAVFLSVQDNKEQRRVQNLKDLVNRHGGDVRADRFDKALEGEKGYRYNCVLLVSDKVAKVLTSHMEASDISDVAARVTFKSKKGIFSKVIDNQVFNSPESGFEETFSWFKNDFSKAPWEFLKNTYPSEFASHCKEVNRDGSQMLRINIIEGNVRAFSKGNESRCSIDFL